MNLRFKIFYVYHEPTYPIRNHDLQSKLEGIGNHNRLYTPIRIFFFIIFREVLIEIEVRCRHRIY